MRTGAHGGFGFAAHRVPLVDPDGDGAGVLSDGRLSATTTSAVCRLRTLVTPWRVAALPRLDRHARRSRAAPELL